jgi:hypothetical protein
MTENGRVMRKLLVSNFLSLDGYYESKGKTYSSTTSWTSTGTTKRSTSTTETSCGARTR